MKSRLSVKWSKKDNDLICDFPKKTSANYLFTKVFNDDFVEEITKRGYDLKTLKFSIELKSEEVE